MTLAWSLAAVALLILPGVRLHESRQSHRSSRSRWVRGGYSQVLRGAASLGSGASLFCVSANAVAVVAALGSSVAVWALVPKLLTRSSGLDAAEVARMPLVLDLVTSVLRAGQPVGVALTLGADAAGPRLREELRRTGALLRLGALPSDAWSKLAEEPRLRPVAVVAVRSADSGIRLAAAWSALAGELRAEAATGATARANRTGTWVMAPLGLCFLPSFICLGIAPVVVGIATELIGQGQL
jgi:Flp pilus assembly protein TadB